MNKRKKEEVEKKKEYDFDARMKELEDEVNECKHNVLPPPKKNGVGTKISEKFFVGWELDGDLDMGFLWAGNNVRTLSLGY